MTRVLYVMRHAKSSWKTPVGDHARPLNERGQRASRRMAIELRQRGWLPELVLVSDAERTLETLVWMEDTLGVELPRQVCPRLYLPGVDDVRREIQQVDASVTSLMVLSHNPACEEVVQWLTGKPARYTTANLGRVVFEEPTWADAVAEPARGTLTDLLRPKELPEVDA